MECPLCHQEMEPKKTKDPFNKNRERVNCPVCGCVFRKPQLIERNGEKMTK